VEVPLTSVQPQGENFAALWSNSPAFTSVSSSPVLAAGWGGKEANTWLLRDIHGAPPAAAQNPPGAAITYFQPAIALKLIPAGPAHPLAIRVISWTESTADHPSPILTADVAGPSVERAWLEAAVGKKWRPVGRPLWKSPYIFSLPVTELPAGKVSLRVAAVNVWEEQTTSAPLTVQVSLPSSR
jgi:hypothetical protein